MFCVFFSPLVIHNLPLIILFCFFFFICCCFSLFVLFCMQVDRGELKRKKHLPWGSDKYDMLCANGLCILMRCVLTSRGDFTPPGAVQEGRKQKWALPENASLRNRKSQGSVVRGEIAESCQAEWLVVPIHRDGGALTRCTDTGATQLWILMAFSW